MSAPAITLPNDLEILVQREFRAPPALVYRAWTEPDLVRRWWAGRRGEMVSCDIDLRVGGAYRFVMTAHGGFEVAFHGEYLELWPGERIVQTEVFEGAPPSHAGDVLNVIGFAPIDGGTRLDLLVQAPNQEIRDAIAGSGMEVGMAEQMEILDELLPALA